MPRVEELIHAILTKSEHFEESVKQTTDLKDVTMKQLNCIELIHTLENPTLSELTETLGTTKASTSVMLDRLEQNGFIRKVKSDRDRRSAHVHLTVRGDRAAQLHAGVHQQFARLLTRGLSESEKEALIVLLQKAIHSIGSETLDGV